ncbi:Metal-dependent hydrolase, endonuclease/exonuclease/phosphatase family [Cognatiyoonia koreensis]|uniref:Metal-dependent hydrolase, endonuclease/exonuclease/phosphatase family n=1 Tax=Cognatiyoonia koreensis TaxID=364200 RepID=A0A1I0NPZ2_9RHOB|nr:Metal-dependent hydrolase, endonuclease/exonuclease/phosphatase family [Cognatiyoonia koreensis]
MTTTGRICSWNIRKALGTDRKRHPARILSILDYLQADIMVLQEADFRLGDRKPALPNHLLQDVGFRAVDTHPASPSIGWHGNAILLRRGISVDDVDLIRLPGLEPRGALCAELSGRFGKVRIIGLHLGLLRRSRRQQMAHLVDVLDHRREMPTLLAGDFNERSQARGFEPFASDFKVLSAGPTFHSRFPRIALDRMAHNALVEMSKLKPLLTAQTRLASDHLPIVGAFRVAA